MYQVPTGSVWMQHLQAVLNKQMEPRDLISLSLVKHGIMIPVQNGIYQFMVRTPTIIQFLNNAYKGKKQEMINDNSYDMYYSGYIAGVCTLDIDTYYKSNGVEKNFFKSSNIEDIDYVLSNLTPDDHEIFEKQITNYINKYSVVYEIPAIKCPHCKNIMTQQAVNMMKLFFEVKDQKGL